MAILKINTGMLGGKYRKDMGKSNAPMIPQNIKYKYFLSANHSPNTTSESKPITEDEAIIMPMYKELLRCASI